VPTILLIDDDDGVRQVIEEHLAEAGFDVVSAADTIIGRRQFDRHPNVDLCLVDIVMPPGAPDGTSFAQSVRSDMPAMPVILMTGYRSAIGSVADIATSLMHKPIDLDALTAEIERHLAT
jgi:DNA-binding NtrC family response regulator